MRPRFALVPLAALLLFVPVPAMSQDATGEPLVLLQDDANDVAAYARTGVDTVPADAPPGTFDSADLLGLSITETPAEFQFHLALATLDAGPTSDFLASLQYTTTFRHVDNLYLLRMHTIGDSHMGYLELVAAPDERFGTYITDVPVTGDAATATLTAAVPRNVLVDTQGSAPYPGRVLDFFSVRAGFLNEGGFVTTGNGVTVPWAYVEDRMPKEGTAEVAFPVAFGIVQSGDLSLSSEEPFRASNGEAGTFVFRVNATNLGAEEQVAEFVAVSAPAGWDVRVPGLVRLEPNETSEFPVIVRTAFNHLHGTATAFTVELASQSDPSSIGRIQLGLRYPKIPQPAGHHNTVYLHNVDESDDPLRQGVGLVNYAISGYDYLTYPYMNTALPEDDPDDDGTQAPGQTCQSLRVQDDGDQVGTTYCWDIPLSPGLEMGLDFDLATLGAYSIPIHSTLLQPGARVQGQLLYYTPDQQIDPFYYVYEAPTIVATLLPSERTDIDLDERVVFEGAIQAEPEGDYLAYERGAGLVLHLEVLTSRADNPLFGPHTEPSLDVGGWLQLPLLEYEDPVDEVFGIASHLHLMLDGDSHRMANPGDTVVFEVDLHNADDQDHDFQAVLVGSNHAWGRVIGGERFSVAADGSRSLTVAVTIPSDALDDDRADLVLEVASRDDATIRALVRLVTTADLDEEHEDHASLLGQAASPKDAPSPSIALLALALLGLALRRR